MIPYKIFLIEKYIEQQFKKGLIPGSVHLSFGQELMDAKYADFDGWVLGNHRSHGQYIARTDDIEGLLEQVYEGMSQHLYYPGKFISTGIQGGLAAVAVGLASQGEKVRCFIGDGTVNQGILWEALGLSYGLPVEFIIYDNGYSMSKTQRGWLHEVVKTHPQVIYKEFTRPAGHSGNDTQMYRPAEERQEYKPVWVRNIEFYRWYKETKQEVNERINNFEKRNKLGT